MKLLTLLKSLQPDEYKEFEKFLQSPFFKASGQYLAFFKYLCKRQPGFELDKAGLEAAYRHCFGKVAFTDGKLYGLMSGMAKQVEQYLAVKLLMPNGDEPENQLQKKLLVQSLGQRNMGAYFRTEAQRLIEAVEALPTKTLNDYHALEQLYQEAYFNPDTQRHLLHQPALHLAADNLDLYYFVSVLRYAAEMKARERILGFGHRLPMLEAVLAHTSDPDLWERHPLVAVYNRIVDMYQHGVSENKFRELKALFTAKFQALPKDDQRELLTHLINFGVMLNSTEVDVNPEILELYKLAITEKMLVENERITHVTFSNIVAVAAVCREFGWAESFIATFAPYLEAGRQKPAVALSQALVAYHKGDLAAAQTSLVAEVFQLPIFDVAGRVLLLKIAFDLYLQDGSNFAFLAANINAFKKYLKGKESLTEERKLPVLNYIKFVRKMMALKNREWVVRKEDKEKLLASFERTSPIISKSWVKDKIASL